MPEDILELNIKAKGKTPEEVRYRIGSLLKLGARRAMLIMSAPDCARLVMVNGAAIGTVWSWKQIAVFVPNDPTGRYVLKSDIDMYYNGGWELAVGEELVCKP